MSLRAALEDYPADTLLVVFTTLGHVYVGTVMDIQDDTVRLARPDAQSDIVINLNDVSGVRPFDEEPEASG
jgi:hypothetical protein